MFNGATNFYNLNNENFHDFLMEMYRKIDLLDKDTNYIRNHLIDELRKELRKIIANGELIVDIESVVDDFLSNGLDENKVVTDIKKKLEKCSSQLDDIEKQNIINAKSYGFIGDGKTLNDDIMKKFIENNSNDVLYFTKGVYLFSKTINFNNNITSSIIACNIAVITIVWLCVHK